MRYRWWRIGKIVKGKKKNSNRARTAQRIFPLIFWSINPRTSRENLLPPSLSYSLFHFIIFIRGGMIPSRTLIRGQLVVSSSWMPRTIAAVGVTWTSWAVLVNSHCLVVGATSFVMIKLFTVHCRMKEVIRRRMSESQRSVTYQSLITDIINLW